MARRSGLAQTFAAFCVLTTSSILLMTWLLLTHENVQHPSIFVGGNYHQQLSFFLNGPDTTGLSNSLRRSIQAVDSPIRKMPIAPEPEPFECTPRPRHVQDKVDKRTTPLIYFHEGPPVRNHEKLHEMYIPKDKEIPCFHCDWTVQEDRAMEADVVVVLYRRKTDYGDMKRIPTKYCGQLFVMVQTECPNNIDMGVSPEDKFQDTRMFDVSSTYRLDSDLPRPYVLDVRMMLRLAKENYVPVEERDSKFPVGWIASRCETTNDRIDYVEELMKHIGVKSYGKCLNNAQMNVTRHEKDWKQAADTQVGKHKFYLAFENSNCDYYVTEKYFRTLQVGLIPIIMGAPQARLYVPNNHSAIFVNDFDSPADLAKKLHEINNNDTLFNSYMTHLFDPREIDVDFHNRWLRKRPHHACQLCDLARSTFRENLKGVPYEHWNACEERYGTWKTNFEPKPRTPTQYKTRKQVA